MLLSQSEEPSLGISNIQLSEKNLTSSLSSPTLPDVMFWPHPHPQLAVSSILPLLLLPPCLAAVQSQLSLLHPPSPAWPHLGPGFSGGLFHTDSSCCSPLGLPAGPPGQQAAPSLGYIPLFLLAAGMSQASIPT